MLAYSQGRNQLPHRLNSCAEAVRQKLYSATDWIAELTPIPTIASSIGLGLISAVFAEVTPIGLAFTIAAAIISINLVMTNLHHDSIKLITLLAIISSLTAGLAIPFKYVIETASNQNIIPDLGHIAAAGAVFGSLFYFLQQQTKNRKDAFTTPFYIALNAVITYELVTLVLLINAIDALQKDQVDLAYFFANAGKYSAYFISGAVLSGTLGLLKLCSAAMAETESGEEGCDNCSITYAIAPLAALFFGLYSVADVLIPIVNFFRFFDTAFQTNTRSALVVLCPIMLVAYFFRSKLPKMIALPALYTALDSDNYGDEAFMIHAMNTPGVIGPWALSAMFWDFNVNQPTALLRCLRFMAAPFQKCAGGNSNGKCFKNFKALAGFTLPTLLSLISNIGDISNIASQGSFIFETQLNLNAIAVIIALIPISVLSTLYPKLAKSEDASTHLRILCKLATQFNMMIQITSLVAMASAFLLGLSKTDTGPTTMRLAMMGMLMGLPLTLTAYLYHMQHRVAKFINLETGEKIEQTPGAQNGVPMTPDPASNPLTIISNPLQRATNQEELPATPAASRQIRVAHMTTPTEANTTATAVIDWGSSNGIAKTDAPTTLSGAHV